MKWMLDISTEDLPHPIDYLDPILMTGSCFTEHIGDSLAALKFSVLQNPNGILFDPAAVAASLLSYVDNRQYAEEDLVQVNELWQSWHHHGRFSGVDRAQVLAGINEAQRRANDFLHRAKWLVITLGSAFSYRLVTDGTAVANCHRAPASWFHKHLMSIEEIVVALDGCLYRLFLANPDLRVIFTVSPVRHIRDGVVDNNRSKARLLEAVHHLVNKFERLHYFPAYELVIDVLRDYRFYDVDLVHPNYQATRFVIDHFMRHCVNERSVAIAAEVEKINVARRHRPFQPETEAHRKFLRQHARKVQELMKEYPFLRLHDELKYFSKDL